MKLFTLPFLMFLFALPALAARPDSRKMTCREATGLVDERRSVTMQYGKHSYDRIFAHSGYCAEFAPHPAYLPTLDNKSCLVGYTCGPTPARASQSGGEGGTTVIGASHKLGQEGK